MIGWVLKYIYVCQKWDRYMIFKRKFISGIESVKCYTQWYGNKTSTESYIKMCGKKKKGMLLCKYVTDAYLISLILLIIIFGGKWSDWLVLGENMSLGFDWLLSFATGS